MYKSRVIYDVVNKHLDKKEYTIITGARQVGKTTLVRKLYADLKGKGSSVTFISLENIDLLRQIDEHPENLFRFAPRPANALDRIVPYDERQFIIIDEIQYLTNPSGFLKYLFDTYLSNLKVIATGSSAFYIDTKFKDSLAGRKRIFRMYPLCFAEYLSFTEREELSAELAVIRNQVGYISTRGREIYQAFNEYLIYGGYPAVALELDPSQRKEMLMELRNSIIKRDIHEAGIKNPSEFHNLMILMAEQVGNLVNRHELAKTLSIHSITVSQYLQVLQACFHIVLVKPFYRNIRKELTKMPKVYFNDLGLRNAMLNRFQPLENRDDRGALLENYAFIRLQNLHDNDSIKFWRTADGNEIDFVITLDGSNGLAYEIKFNGMEYRGNKYKKFTTAYPTLQLIPMAYNPYGEVRGILTL